MSHDVHANVLYPIMGFIILINEWRDNIQEIKFLPFNYFLLITKILPFIPKLD